MSHSKENQPTVSIIIPVFNRERFIGNLLNSVLQQSFSDYEVICVDNGSTDKTHDMIVPFCKKDERFICVTKEHGSAGSARNKGLDLARGKYIMFFDSDDGYHQDMLKEMVSTAEKHNADEVFCLCEEYNYRTHIKRENLGFDYNYFPDDVPVKTAEVTKLFQRINWVVTNAIFLKEIIDQHHLRYPESRASEDLLFICEYAAMTKTIVGIRKTFVTYRKSIDGESLTSARWRYSYDTIDMLIELRDWLIEKRIYNEYRETYLLLFIYAIKGNGQFPVNPRYIDAVTEALCSGDFFSEIDQQELYDRYWSILDKEDLIKRIRYLYTKDNAREDEVQSCCNLLLTILSIEEQAQKKYGRILNPNKCISS